MVRLFEVRRLDGMSEEKHIEIAASHSAVVLITALIGHHLFQKFSFYRCLQAGHLKS